MTDLKPGRELDQRIEEFVMGGRESLAAATTQAEHERARCRIQNCPEYSYDIAAAFEVVRHVMATYRSKISIETYDGKIWSIKPCDTSSTSLPHAICLAALKAKDAS